MDCSIQAYFRLSDDEFDQFFRSQTEEELFFIMPPEQSFQTFSERRKVSQILDKFYINYNQTKEK